MASTSRKACTKSMLTPTITLKGHRDIIRSMSYFPDGQRMMSGSWDKTARKWDLKAGKEIEEARGVYEGSIWAVAVSRNGRWAATGGGEWNRPELTACEVEMGIMAGEWVMGSNTARIWNLDTGELMAGPFKSEDPVGAVQFSPNSKKLAVMSLWGRCLEVWDVQSQNLDVRAGELDRSPGTRVPVLWTNNNKTIIIAFSFADNVRAKRVYEFDASTLETVRTPFRGHTGDVTVLALSFDDALLASASLNNTIKLWAFESRQLLASFDVQHIDTLVLSPNSRQLAYPTYSTELYRRAGVSDYNICICDIPQKVLARAHKIARTKSNLDHLFHSHATRLLPGHRRVHVSLLVHVRGTPRQLM
ncbi:hypothetical protein CY34DRAFT_17315 [Suillus luteus UH-Slu-Lm8-n1]|uniref:WD40 repeat-like protein n=1 Tax=Suillus luteus UH-Slu-Lm8-n1 TaxID=930992 RepID=A0A0D0AL85_9AGAM|nr:hypothetical protein CY34DRAFT_17315 [Suillus luteus UH-Slu-Lm8-n1]